ncbi:MAG: hypothetical protein HQK54_06125 [Oligoflexales bacterium]|nr:hypothetical protein [Oligoflexales bacterium]
MGSIILGSFDAEKYWRDESLAGLPFIPDINVDKIVSSMDDLLFPFCGSGDLLVTLEPFDEVLRQYLESVGFTVNAYGGKIVRPEYCQSGSTKPHSIFTVLNYKENLEELLKVGEKYSCLLPYAVLPDADKLALNLGLAQSPPCYESVRLVNSKEYSFNLRNELMDGQFGFIAGSVSDLEKIGLDLLKNGPFLIKDYFGVSGKGSILIQSDRILKSIAGHLKKQEQAGKTVGFLLEPYLEKDFDFSCGLQISREGEIKIVTLQRMLNQGFAFRGIHALEKSHEDELTGSGYFEIMESLGRRIHKDGYHGYVCIDSMKLKNGRFMPVVEINARQSMGIINSKISEHVSNFNMTSYFTFLPLGFTGEITFSDFFTNLEGAGLLFSARKKEGGIIPLSANTLKLCLSHNPALKKSRFYFAVIAENASMFGTIVENVKSFLKSSGFAVYE